MEKKLFLGVGRSIITPKVGACLTGYRPDIFSTSVNDVSLTDGRVRLRAGKNEVYLITLK